MQEPECISEEVLRACVELEMRYPDARSIMLTGPAGREGTTTVTCLCARGLAEMYDAEVIIVDANLRSPAVHKKFTTPLEAGLRDWDLSAVEGTVHPSSEYRQLSVMPAGKANGRSLQSMAHTGRLDRLATWLRQRFRFVLWDTPPPTRYPEGRFLLPYIDGVMIVVESDETTRESLAGLHELLAPNSNIMGAIMNRTGRYSVGGSSASKNAPRHMRSR